MNSGRVLVVASDDDLRRSVTFALVAYGYTVTAEARWPLTRESADFDCAVVDERALAMRPTAALPVRGKRAPLLLLAYSPEARANLEVSGVIAMPLNGESVIQAVAAALAPGHAPTK